MARSARSASRVINQQAAAWPTGTRPTGSVGLNGPPHIYSVRVTATNAAGSDTKTRTNYITVTQPL